MTFSLGEALTAITLGLLVFCTSCEKHPLGQMPEVQREQVDPAEKMEPEKSSSSPTPVEFFPRNDRP
jgi:hypothetical protein